MMSAACLLSQAEPLSVLKLDRSLQDSTVIYPESVETNTNKMMHNWYLSTYAQLDSLADYRESVSAPDEVIVERLGKLPYVIEIPFNSLVRGVINMYTQRKRSLVENMLGMSHYYNPIFEAALEKEQMPLELKYLPVIESALNPDAVSRAGATGLWQFMTPTARGLGLEINSVVDERRDPVKSSEMAAKYLKQLYEIYNDWSLAIAAYNCGPGNVNKALRRAGEGKKDFWDIYPFLPAETRGYVPCFIGACYVMNYHNEHNIAPALTKKPIITDTIHVNKRVHFKQIADVLQIPVEEIRALNPQYRQDIIPGNIRPYSLVLPSQQVYAYLMSEDSIVSHDATLYNRRSRVEPSDGSQISVTSDGKYMITEKTQYHKVQRGETLSSIARKYGVTVSSLRNANGIRSVRRGQTIKVVTVQRTLREDIEETSKPDENESVTADDANSADSLNDGAGITVDPAAEEVEEKPQPKAEPQKKQKIKTESKQSGPVYVKVRRGDSLSKIAKRNHTTVSKLRQLNGLKNDNIQAGQSLRVK